jgi:ABC-type dipeptide/oligopeptide/nickel transport system permease subunit
MLKVAKKNNNPSIDNVITRICNVMLFFYFAFVLMLLRYCFAYRNRKLRDIIIILKTVKFNFLILTDTVVSRQTADVTLGGILQL